VPVTPLTDPVKQRAHGSSGLSLVLASGPKSVWYGF
jgi:hypothetical protein